MRCEVDSHHLRANVSPTLLYPPARLPSQPTDGTPSLRTEPMWPHALAGSVLAAFAHDLAGLVVARLVQGAGAAAGSVVGRASVQDLFHGPQRTRVMAYIGMAMGLCPPAATRTMLPRLPMARSGTRRSAPGTG